MRTAGRRLVAAVAGAGIVVAAGPALAASRDDSDESAALVLLADAAQASRTLAYSGTQYVATWSPADTTTAVVEVQHTPGRGAEVRTTPDDGRAHPVTVASGVLDAQLVVALARRYELRLAGDGRCTGRSAQVVEARRPGRTGPAALAGRFWVDRESGLLLRREVFDSAGNRLRSTAFLDLSVSSPPPPRVPFLLRAATNAAPDDAADPVPSSRLQRMRDHGLDVPEELPGGYALFDATSRDHGGAEVLHLAYSDGLSTTSLFSQPGRLGSSPPAGFTRATLAGKPVWWSAAAPQRAVWAGGGRVWTLVSDAPPDDVEAAMKALPHEALPDVDTGLRARLTRGLVRLGGALNPFS